MNPGLTEMPRGIIVGVMNDMPIWKQSKAMAAKEAKLPRNVRERIIPGSYDFDEDGHWASLRDDLALDGQSIVREDTRSRFIDSVRSATASKRF